MNDSDYVMILYDHPNRGSHRVVGAATRRDYGYRSGGEKFLVHRADVAAQAHIFKVEEEKKPEPQRVEIIEVPAPKPVFTEPPERVYILPPDESEFEEDETYEPPFDLQTVPGVTPTIAQELNAAGVHNLEDLLDMSENILQKFKGIGPARASAMLNYAREQLQESDE